MQPGKELNRLADFATNRRVQLGLDRDAVAARMGKSSKTVERIENGKSVRNETYAALEVALEWEPGSVRAILAGGEPTSTGQPEPEPTDEVAELREMVQSLQAQAAASQALAQKLMERLDKLGQPGEHRAAQ